MLTYRRGRLFIDGVGAWRLAERFGTPLYAYSKKAILESFGRFEAAFSLRPTTICYAMKANSNRAVCALLAGRGAGAEVVSGGELLRALEAGFAPGRIVFSGVGKTDAEMALAIERAILAVNVESMEELEALEGVARRLGRRAPVSVRLNPDVDAGTHAHVSTGLAETKFGVEKAQAMAMFVKAMRSPHLKVLGIHCHIGSQIATVGPYKKAARAVAGLVRDLEGKGVALEFVDLGGGMGVAYGQGKGLGLGELSREFARVLAPWPEARLIVEPGRSLTAGAGVLLTRVLYRKQTTKRRFIVVDAGMNDLLRPALYGAVHPIWPERRRGGKGAAPADVVGPICESADFLGKDVRLPGCRRGDVLALLKAGAYGFSMSSQYNSRPRAAEVIVDGDDAVLARRRETLDDLVAAERGDQERKRSPAPRDCAGRSDLVE
ncbi:MAG: diaminopimelate decarboxylase [Elusimicrobia bacterium]|nr:diaminopimelate decarboxylase [Elusimicrobiota bacterium]